MWLVMIKGVGNNMHELDKRAWKRYVETRHISKEELQDEVLCKELRETTDFASCRMYIASCDFGNEILKTFCDMVKKLSK